MSIGFLQRLATLKPPRRSRKVNILLALLLVGCSSSTIETFGCGCESWSVSQQQLAEWRKKAPQGDIEALKGMRDYAHWHTTTIPFKTPEWQYWQDELDLANQRLINAGDIHTMWFAGWNTLHYIQDADERNEWSHPRIVALPRSSRLALFDANLAQMERAVAMDEQKHRSTPGYESLKAHRNPKAELATFRSNRNALARRWGLPERRF